jgi:hypothetical protein
METAIVTREPLPQHESYVRHLGRKQNGEFDLACCKGGLYKTGGMISFCSPEPANLRSDFAAKGPSKPAFRPGCQRLQVLRGPPFITRARSLAALCSQIAIMFFVRYHIETGTRIVIDPVADQTQT